MKRLGVVLCLSVLLVALATSFCFADDFAVKKTFPEEGNHTLNPVNIAVKIEFTDNVTSKDAQKWNAECFTLKNSSGKKIAVKPLYNAKVYPNEIWVQVTKTLNPAEDYVFTVSGDLKNSDGEALGQDYVVHFSTRDTAKDNKVNMGIMALMFVGMMVFTVWETKHKLKKEAEAKRAASNEKVNPYKEAKKTGKSVEEIVAKTEKEKARQAKRKHAAIKKEEAEIEIEDTADDGVKHVKAARPIASAGGTLPKSVADKRAAKAKAEAERAARKAKPKSKGSKQQQKKNKK